MEVTVQASHIAYEHSQALFAAAGAQVERKFPDRVEERPKLGKSRHAARALALQLNCPFHVLRL
jgi:hypothetical protein